MYELANGVEAMTADCPVCGLATYTNAMKITMVGCIPEPPPHDHDWNCRTFTFRCANGHKFSIRVVNTCPDPDCAWRGKQKCFCHPVEAKLL